MSTNPQARSWIRVRADALKQNFSRLRDEVGPETRIIPMVKADGYGLGVKQTVRTLQAEDPWGWGVATADEGLELREIGVEDPVIVFCPLTGESLDRALSGDLQLTVSSLMGLDEVITRAYKLDRKPHVHVDINTGMGRTGFDWRVASSWLPRLQEAVSDSINWVGFFTHLHSADEDELSVHNQWSRLQEVLAQLKNPPDGLMVHLLNSSGLFRTPDYAAAAVRPGIFLYGGEVGVDQPSPVPLVSLHARVIHVGEVSEGYTLGYGATYIADGPERWATLGIGYGDGLPRSLGNRGSAFLGGVRVPIIGRISMDMTVVNITDVPKVAVGDIATLIAAIGHVTITVDDVAELAGTISYEVLTGFTDRLPRVWTGLNGS